MPTEITHQEPVATPASETELPSETSWAAADAPEPFIPPVAEPSAVETESEPSLETAPVEVAETATSEAAAGEETDAWWNAAPPAPASFEQTPPASGYWSEASSELQPTEAAGTEQWPASATDAADLGSAVPAGSAFFCGDTSFFSLNWALQAIATQKLTGTLRCFWNRDTIELLARDGQVLLATTRDPALYCSEAPITLVSVDPEQIERARQLQRETSRPLFSTLAQEEAIMREPAVQLVQHYGQKLFAQLWTAPRVRFMFEQSQQLPAYADEIPGEDDLDHWALGTLRFIQYQDLGTQGNYDNASIPAYTRDGFSRVQKLRLTVAEAQFASQFNGARSIAQIAKNLRLDFKFARLTLFRFLALEIVECWPPVLGAPTQKRGVFGRLFGG